jgi:hypothetical protein
MQFRRWREVLRSDSRTLLTPFALYTALTAVMTWPQLRQLGTHAADHHDVYFNMWRLGWVAHALSSAPADLFEGNIFYPARRTLTLSDAMLVEGVVATPLLWAGVPPVLVHNLLLLGAIVASALAMFVLVRRLTGASGPAFIAGIIFAFVPYRFDHYMHLELQWTIWLPLAFWAVHRTIDSGRVLHGLQAGAFVALQMLSSVYYGIFLSIVLTLVSGLLLLAMKRPRRFAARALLIGGAAAAIVCCLYALPYLATKEEVGGRPGTEIARYSARAWDYLRATPDNTMYGWGEADVSLHERRLFPGALPFMLAIVALLWRPPGDAAFAWVLALAVAFEMSLGVRGYSYSFLSEHVPIFAALRAPARLGIFVVMCLAVLAGYGYAVVRDAVSTRARAILPWLVTGILLMEYRVAPLQLVRYDNSPPSVYSLIAALPPGVIAELPMARPDSRPGPDAFYTYMSTFHWRPIINGYSGFYPETYLPRLRAVRGFPDDNSLQVLRNDGVNYVVVHLSSYEPDERVRLVEALEEQVALRYLGRGRDGIDLTLVYQVEE